jgi:hypothetical protein
VRIVGSVGSAFDEWLIDAQLDDPEVSWSLSGHWSLLNRKLGRLFGLLFNSLLDREELVGAVVPIFCPGFARSDHHLAVRGCA